MLANHVGKPGKNDRSEFKYTAEGSLAEITQFFHDGSFYRNWFFKCDKKNNVIKQAGYENTDSKYPFRIIEYKYDDSNRLIEIHKHTGHPIGVASVTGEKEKYEDQYYEYDSKGFVVKRTIKRKGFGALFDGEGIAEFVNDANGKPLVHYSIGKQNAKEKMEESTYYETGLPEKVITYMGNLTVCNRYDYQYDDRRNWTTKKEYKVDAHGKSSPSKIITRKIAYY